MKHFVKLQRLSALSLVVLLFAGILAACGDNTATTAPAATTAAATTAANATTAASATTAAGATTAAATTAASATTAAAPAPTATPYPTVAQAPGSIKITFWHGFSGFNAGVLQQVVNKFNSSQTKYYVEAVAQGGDYDATFNKFNTTLAGGTLPNLIQMYDIGTQRMIDSKKIVPAQDMIDKEKLDIISDLEPAVASYYTVGGKLYSMPLNSSAPVMYFDKNAFKEVGLDVNKKEWTYDEVLDAAKKLTKKDSSGKVSRYGVVFTLYSWIFEQELATQNALLADPGNGRGTARATKMVFNSDAGVNWLNLLKSLLDQGVALNVGRDSSTSNGSVRDASFVKGESAITFNSIAGLRGYISSAASAGGKVDVGVAYLPKPAGAKGGVIIGGASLWMTNTGNADQQAGAWEFMKFVGSPETQAFFASNTGYYPTRKAAYNVQDMKDALTKYPQFQVAIDELRATQASPATQGAVFGTFLPTRLAIEASMEQFVTGKVSTAKAALDDAAKKSNDLLDEYNSTVK